MRENRSDRDPIRDPVHLLAESSLTLEPRPEDWLDHHRIDGVRVVPAAVTAVWMLEALRSAPSPDGTEPARPRQGSGETGDAPSPDISGRAPVAALSRIRWLRPLRCGDQGLTVRICVYRNETGGGRRVEVTAPRLRGDGSAFGRAVYGAALEDAGTTKPGLPRPLARLQTLSRLPSSFQGPYWQHLGLPLRLGKIGADAPLARADLLGPLGPPLTSTGHPPVDPRVLDALFQLAGTWRQLSGEARGLPAAAAGLRVVWGCRSEGGFTLHVRGDSGSPSSLTLLAGSRSALEVSGYEAGRRHSR